MKTSMRLGGWGITAVILMALSACTTGGSGIDMNPIRSGLEFLGMAGVLAALIIVLGRFIR